MYSAPRLKRQEKHGGASSFFKRMELWRLWRIYKRTTCKQHQLNSILLTCRQIMYKSMDKYRERFWKGRRKRQFKEKRFNTCCLRFFLFSQFPVIIFLGSFSPSNSHPSLKISSKIHSFGQICDGQSVKKLKLINFGSGGNTSVISWCVQN